MTDDELLKLQALCDAATTAPWSARIDMDEGWLVCSLGNSSDDGNDWHVMTAPMSGSECAGDAKTDADFIAAARTALPELIAEVGLLRKKLDFASDLTEFKVVPGSATLKVRAPAILAILTHQLHKWFKENGAENNMTGVLTWEGLDYSVHAQRKLGKTPAEQRDEARAENDKLRAENESLKAEMARLVLATENHSGSATISDSGNQISIRQPEPQYCSACGVDLDRPKQALATGGAE